MDIDSRIRDLYSKDIKSSYQNLLELEALSEQKNTLYPYLNEFISMLECDTYVIKVRGFRLLCKQAKWDVNCIIDENIGKILNAISDKKPTAVRQALQYLQYLIPYKKELNSRIKEAVISLDYSGYKDTMRPLIEKDMKQIIGLIDQEQA